MFEISMIELMGVVIASFVLGLTLGYVATKAAVEHSITKYWLNTDWILFKGWKRTNSRPRASVVEYTHWSLKDSQKLISKYQEQFVAQLQRQQFPQRPTAKHVGKLPNNVTPFPKK